MAINNIVSTIAAGDGIELVGSSLQAKVDADGSLYKNSNGIGVSINNLDGALQSVGNGVEVNVNEGIEIVSNGLSISDSYLAVASGTITPTQFKNIVSDAIPLMSSPGAGKMLRLLSLFIWVDYASVQYTSGVPIRLTYSSTGQHASESIPASFFTDYAESNYIEVRPATAQPLLIADAENSGFSIDIAAGGPDFADGDSPIKWIIQYAVVSV